MDELKCALVQADTRWADPDGNRRNLERLMDQAPGCDLYVLPETCTTGFLGDTDESTEQVANDDVAWLIDQAARRGGAVAGSIVFPEQGRFYNRFLFVTPDGAMETYDKRHLFAYGGESDRYSAGRRRKRLDWNGWRVDLQVCFDLRFPVWCRNDDGFDLQLFVANWPTPRVDAWRSLLKARAIENQTYVIGINRVGKDGKGVIYPGSSMAFDAMGATLRDCGDDEVVEVVTLERGALEQVRKRFRFLELRDGFLLPDEDSGE